jgi:hypothetical protein
MRWFPLAMSVFALAMSLMALRASRRFRAAMATYHGHVRRLMVEHEALRLAFGQLGYTVDFTWADDDHATLTLSGAGHPPLTIDAPTLPRVH